MTRPWHKLPINSIDEPLVELPKSLHRLEPHPYLSLGAPYGHGLHPWFLREKVILKLLQAERALQKQKSNLRLAIFDAWRPIPVQAFMVDYVIKQECIKKGLDISLQESKEAYRDILENVEKFWAAPSVSSLTPPPHSTGGAVDITLANDLGDPLDMGGEIDELGPISYPSYYSKSHQIKSNSLESVWNFRRVLLFEVMNKVGFVQHPNEWWHFSYGDQLWAWRSNSSNAFYGACSVSESKS